VMRDAALCSNWTFYEAIKFVEYNKAYLREQSIYHMNTKNVRVTDKIRKMVSFEVQASIVLCIFKPLKKQHKKRRPNERYHL